MELRSWFSNIFGNDKNTTPPSTATEVKILDDRKAIFTPYKGDFQNDPDILKCIDAIARNGAKMHPRHIRNFKDKIENLKDNLYTLLAKRPNEVQNAYQFYYQVISNLELYNDSFIYVKRDENLKVTGLYPLNFSEGKYYEFKGNLYLKLKFGRTKERFVPYDSCIHLTRFVGEDGLFGGSPKAIIKTLSIKHVLDEGIVNAIKTTQAIKGVIKSTKTMLKPEDVKKMRDQFVSDFVKQGDKSGIGGLDATTEFTPVTINPTTASDSQVKSIDDKLLAYFGISDEIIQSKYNEDQWNAFYESILEPIGLQMSLEFSNKIFTPTEKYFGHEILFESNRLQYASNKTKIELLRYGNNIMTINELREIFNLSPREDGDVIMQDLNHIDSSIANDYQVGNDTSNNNDLNEEGGNSDEGKGD